MTWKLALYDFIHARNQMETDYNWSVLTKHVEDERFLHRTREQQERRRLQHAVRGLVPVRSETRLALLHAEEKEGSIAADIRLTRAFSYRAGSFHSTEERSETERLELALQGRTRWTVRRITTHPAADRDTREIPYAGGHLPDREASQIPAPLLNRKQAAVKKSAYDREKVRQYAEQYWNSYNPAYLQFEVDCSNYVSQCLLAGGQYMNYTGRREAGWWYRGKSGSQELWSYSWAVANALQVYLGGNRASGLRAELASSPTELMIGDVISYCWDGDGRYGHSTVVTGIDDRGMPLVNAHTVNSRNRYWDYSDSYAWTERTQYRFFHILEP